MYKLFLSLRYLRRRRIAFFAIAAVTLCVAMVLIVVSVLGGFLDMIQERSRGLLGDLILDNQSLQGFAWYEEFIDQLKREMPGEVVAATPVIFNYGILRFPDSNITKPVRIVAIRLQEAYEVNDFKRSLFYEKHYPGTTTLAEQQQPVYGWDENGDPSLPPELKAALDNSGWKPPTDTKPDQAEQGGTLGALGPGHYDMPQLSALFAADQLTMRAEELLNRVRGTATDGGSGDSHAPVEAELEALARRCERLREKLEELRPPAGTLERLQDFAAALGRANTAAQGDDAGLALALEEFVEAGRLLTADLYALRRPGYLGDRLPGVIIGLDLLGPPNEKGDYERPWPRGEKVLLTFLPLTRRGVLSGQQAPVKAMRYVDDSRTGVYEIDSLCVYVDFDFVQDVLAMSPQRLTPELGGGLTPARTTQIQIKLAGGLEARRMRDRIQAEWDGFAARLRAETPPGPLDAEIQQLSWVKVETWEERQRQFTDAIKKEKVLVTILFGVVSVVAVVLVGCVFYMIVQEKTRDIGIVKSIGATSLGVAAIFISYGAAVGVVGSALGTTIGCLFVRYINEIQELLIRINPELRVWSREVYVFDRIPDTVKVFDITWIVAVAIAASMLGSVVAAWRAARVWPVEAIRYE